MIRIRTLSFIVFYFSTYMSLIFEQVSSGYVPYTPKAYPLFAAGIWALVMYLFTYQRGAMQKSIESSMQYLYDDRKPAAPKALALAPSPNVHVVPLASSSASSAAVAATPSLLTSPNHPMAGIDSFSGALYAVIEWLMKDLP
jgi:hypothetical protein